MRQELADALDWGQAHADFDRAVDRFPVALRGRRVRGLPYSAWQILEHVRIAQEDLLDFAANPRYAAKAWPEAYWPADPEPPSPRAWNASIAAFRKDRKALKRLATDKRIKLDAKIPHGTGQTYLREILLAIDHTAYHVGELVILRRLLGAWNVGRKP